MSKDKLPLKIENKADLQKFMVDWELYVATEKNTNVASTISRVLVAFRTYQYYEVAAKPFLIACLEITDPIARQDAAWLLGDIIYASGELDGVEHLFRILETDENSIVKATAATGLGLIASKYPLPDVPPLLLSIVAESSQEQPLRVSAYLGLIVCTDWEGARSPILIDQHISIDEQVDWEWIEELKIRLGQESK